MDKFNEIAKKLLIEMVDQAEKAELEEFDKENKQDMEDMEVEMETLKDEIEDSTKYGYENINDACENFQEKYREWKRLHLDRDRIIHRWELVREKFECLT